MKRFAGDPYRNFLIAIIERAVKDCKRKRLLVLQNKGWKDELLTDPEYFIFDDPDETYPSFLSICAILEYPPGKLRAEISSYLGATTVQKNLTKSEKIESRIKECGIIQRYRLTRYARDSLQLNSKELDHVVVELNDCGVIDIESRLTANERWATYYIWKGYENE